MSDQRHIGGAWRFTQEELTTKKIQVYNNILVALNEGDQKLYHALEMLNCFEFLRALQAQSNSFPRIRE